MIKYLLALTISLHLATIGISQVTTSDTLQGKSELQEVVVSGSKFSERNSKIAVTIKTIRTADLKRLNLSNMANLLESSGLAFIQRSQQGGGSPVIRGFEASRVLLMVDGVRMNNAIYRAGHLQNIITVDPNILHNLEILYGPSSTLYGSDALGGVINVFTRDPKLAVAGQKPAFTANAHARYSSAIDEKMGHIDLNYGSGRWGSLTSLTFTDFGDVRTGKNTDDKYPEFGLKHFYVERVGDRDTVLVNNNPYKQKPSGYRQWDVMQKVFFKPNLNTSHLLNIQVSNSSDIPRYDRLTEVAGNLPRYAEWYYGPQKRYLASYKLEKKNIDGFFGELRAVASYQHIEESRFDRRYRQAVRNERIEKINVAGFTIDARKLMNKNELVVGADFQANDLESTARGYNVDNGSVTKITTRYPDGDNKMYYAAIFAQHLLKITDRLTLHDGLRLNYVYLHSTFIDRSLINFPFNEASQEHTTLSGNTSLVYAANDKFKISTVFSTGFRAPNFDDLAKVFDTRAGSVTVPNPDLKAEYTYNAELNIVKYFPVADNPFGASVGGSVFYTWFRNAIVVDKFRFNEADSIVYNGINSEVLANQNKAKAQLWGYNVYGNLNFNKNLQLNGTVTYTYGRYMNNNTEVPLDHIPPVFGRVGLRYEKAKLSAELNTIFNGWKRIEDYNPNGEDNQQYATPEGMPSWYSINARANYAIAKHVTAQVAVENILDKRYRPFASGISAPGRNFIIALKTEF